ncbi:MAG: sodium:solute symporter family transporter [Actinomycetota bacterium]
MLAESTGLILTFVVLLLFAYVAVRGATGAGDDDYLTARSSQGTASMALTLFASALGTWILFSPPEVGTFGGVLGIVGYAVGQAAAIAIFAYVGPRVRTRIPEGSTILDFVESRFGRTLQVYVAAVSVLYMFVFLAAELTAIGGVVSLLTDIHPVVPVVGVAAITAAYTAYGGLPASISTDRWQGWLILLLVLVGGIALAFEVPRPLTAARSGGAATFTRAGAETFVVLCIAIIAANLFHQGFWQRVWAARSPSSLRRGSLLAGALILPVVFAMGFSGSIAGGRGVEVPSLAFFSLLTDLPEVFLAVVLVLAVALVSSTVDTLQNALTSLVAVHFGRVTFGMARLVTIALTLPAAIIGIQELSVLRLFLIADLLAATVVLPVFLGLWQKVTTRGALAGAVAGILSVIVFGWVRTGDIFDGLLLLTLPDGLSIGPFLVAPIVAGLITVASSAWGRPTIMRATHARER